MALIAAGAATAEAERPNIVFIMSDDHAYQAISAYDGSLNQTPNLDRLAAEGVRFDRCYVTDSICSPSRACILTGKYGHRNGVTNNYTKFDGGQVTFPKLLQRAGYQTAMIGKWHLGSDPTGFDHWDILPGQGKYYRPDFRTADGQRAVDGYVTDVTTDLAVRWLTEQRATDKPFLLMMHHKAPHRPWDPAPDKLAAYRGREFPQPATFDDDYQGRASAARLAEMRIEQMRPSPDLKIWDDDDRHRRWLYKHMSDAARAKWEQEIDPRWEQWAGGNDPRVGDPPLQKRRWMWELYLQDYLACVDSVDESVGRVLATLEEQGLADNTIVVYTSDQGFYLGEHGWFDKRLMYEQSLRTPLLIRWPAASSVEAGRVEKQIVSNVDFAATFLDVAGADVPDAVQGRSFLPMLSGQTPPDWREDLYYHYREGPERDHAVARHEGVTNGRLKLIHYYETSEWELFDLEADPHEVRSVYDTPAYAERQTRMHHRLGELRKELGVPDPTPNGPVALGQ
ncbi:sulfatase family protein [Posidoniimonas polymericola]|uniref:sulfatase family protein n=1 Tax=Posidoniimonas polymericola TaxID=2528002 RepID=UPI001E39A0F2|nr:sulfatase [Posidoniimonas polymericola]